MEHKAPVAIVQRTLARITEDGRGLIRLRRVRSRAFRALGIRNEAGTTSTPTLAFDLRHMHGSRGMWFRLRRRPLAGETLNTNTQERFTTMFVRNPVASWSRCGRAITRAAVLSSLAAGCAGSAQLRGGVIYDYPIYYVEEPPPRIYRYPTAHYHGRPAYLVDGHWYYSSPRGWVYFREEPRELRAYRERHVVRRRSPANPPRYQVPRETRREAPTEGRRRRYESD